MSTSGVPISMTDLMRHAGGGQPFTKRKQIFLQIRSNATSADQLKMPDFAAINN